MTIKGIDVSEHQGNIDWAKVKGNVSFVILRITIFHVVFIGIHMHNQ